MLPPGNATANATATAEFEAVVSPQQASTTIGQRKRLLECIFIVVAFRECDPLRNETLVQRIKDDKRIYVSGTVLLGRAAARIAVAKWDVDVQRDLALVSEVLMAVR